MAQPEYLTDGRGGRYMKIGSNQRALSRPVDVTGRPLTRSPRPIGVYAGQGRMGGGTNLLKTAGMLKMGSVDNALTSPEVRNPLLNIINFFLPYNYRVLAQWIRYYDKFHPMVGNCIDLHGAFPISKFDLKLEQEDKKVLSVYEACVDEIDLFNRLLEMSREYELLGEVFPYSHWNQEKGYFDALILLNPDFIHVDMHPLAFGKDPIIKLEPDELLKSIATSNNPEDVEIRNEMDPMVIAAVLTQQNIRLDPFSVCQIARKSSPYEPRGTSIILRCLKDLLYEDKLREAQFAVADGMITPKTIWKLGDPQNNYMPNEQELADFRQLLQAQAHDPLASIITHYGLSVDIVGYTGRILPIVPEFEFVENRILTALYTNKALTHGEGPTYANASIAMEALQGRYMAKREKLEEFARKKIFEKVALLNEFYEPLTQAQVAHGIRPSKSERKLNIPTFEWKQKLKLVEDMAKKQLIIALRNTAGYGVPGVSLKRIHDLLEIDHEEEINAIREEAKIIRSLQEDYGVQSMMTGNRPQMPGAPAIPGAAPSGQLRLPGMGGVAPVTPREPAQPAQPKMSAARREGEWKSQSMKEMIASPKGKVPVTAASSRHLFEENGTLKDLVATLEKTERELEESEDL